MCATMRSGISSVMQFARALRNPGTEVQRTPEEVFRETVDGLRARRIPFLLHGAWAMGAYGFVRGTTDIDFLIPANERSVRGLYDLMARLPGVPVRPGPRTADQALERFRRGTATARLMRFLSASGWMLDFFADGDFARLRARSRKHGVAGRIVPVIAPRDLYVRKAQRGSHKDLIDMDWLEQHVL